MRFKSRKRASVGFELCARLLFPQLTLDFLGTRSPGRGTTHTGTQLRSTCAVPPPAFDSQRSCNSQYGRGIQGEGDNRGAGRCTKLRSRLFSISVALHRVRCGSLPLPPPGVKPREVETIDGRGNYIGLAPGGELAIQYSGRSRASRSTWQNRSRHLACGHWACCHTGRRARLSG